MFPLFILPLCSYFNALLTNLTSPSPRKILRQPPPLCHILVTVHLSACINFPPPTFPIPLKPCAGLACQSLPLPPEQNQYSSCLLHLSFLGLLLSRVKMPNIHQGSFAASHAETSVCRAVWSGEHLGWVWPTTAPSP